LKIAAIFILTLVTFCFTQSYGQKEFNIKVLNPPQNVKPGGHFTLFFEIEKQGLSLEHLTASLQVPENWQIILSRKYEVNNTSLRYVYTIATPLNAISEDYPLIFKISDGAASQGIKTTRIKVTTVRKVEIIPLSSYEYVREGDSLHLNYLIQNLGNKPEKVMVNTSKGKIWLKNDSLLLEPLKSIQVRVSQVVPKTQSNYWLMSNDLFVVLKDSANPVSNFLSVPVYSSSNKKSDPYLRFPVEAGFWYSHFNIRQKTSSSVQYDFRGHGFLDFKQRHYLDFTVHGPNQINLPAIGSYDQYSLSYSFKKSTQVSVGDYLLAFNNLMEFGRYGRGFRIDQKIAKTGVSAFYLQPRFYPNQKDTYGGRFYFKPKDNLMFSLDFLSKNVKFNGQWFDAKMVGLSYLFRNKAFMINTELATSHAATKSDWGVFNRVYLHHKRIQLTSDLVYAGKNFYGFYHNSWQAVNTLNYYVAKKVSLGVQSNFTRVNPSFDTYALNTSPYYSSNGFLLNYDLATHHRLILSYHIEEKEDRQEIKQFNYKEKYGRLAYLINAERFQLWAENRYGIARNLLSVNDDVKYTQSIRSVIQPQVRTFKWLWIGGFFEYQRNAKFSNSTQLTNYYYYGGTSRMQISNIFNANFSYRNNYAPDELIQRRSYLDLTAELNLKHHRLSAAAGRVFLPNYTQGNENTLYFMVKYALKLNVPLAKNKNLGSIRGSISGNADMKKSGILVSLGDKKFLTDANGNFYFNDLPPDKYYVTIDKSTVNTGTITAVKTPMEVEVEAKNIHDISIPLVVAGGLTGKVLFQSGDSMTVNHQKTIVLVRLFNEYESFMTHVNDKGVFSFKEMQPGQWQVQVSIHGHQNQFEVRNPLQHVVIEPGKLNSLSFMVYPKERKIYFSEESFQISLKK
jgi:hypothetical protein